MLKHTVITKAEEALRKIPGTDKLCKKTVLVGLSGGADSVSLVTALAALSSEYGFSVAACHINHMIRGKEADRDEKFVASYCKKLNVPLYIKKADVPTLAKMQKKSLEEAARDVRYEYFRELCESGKADYIATAHNANDNAETVLFNLTRGSGMAGVCGIPKKRGNIIRPLLNTTRDEIEDFLSQIHCEYVTDSTNLIDDCSRNIIRHKIIPVLCEVNTSFLKQMSKFSEIAAKENEYLDKIALQSISDDIKELSKLDDVILARVIGIICKQKTGNNPGMTHIDTLCREIKKAAATNCGEKKTFLLPGKASAEFECGKFFVRLYDRDKCEYCEYDTELCEGINTVCNGNIIIDYREKSENNQKFCDKLEYNQNIYSLFMETKLFSDIIRGKIRVRSGLPGDKIRISGMSKDIKKIYSAKKIPTSLRRFLPRITDGETDEIISLPYVGVCDIQHDHYDEADISIGLYILRDKE